MLFQDHQRYRTLQLQSFITLTNTEWLMHGSWQVTEVPVLHGRTETHMLVKPMMKIDVWTTSSLDSH